MIKFQIFKILSKKFTIKYKQYVSISGAFLIPYLIFMVILGIPMVFLEFTVGKYKKIINS